MRQRGAVHRAEIGQVILLLAVARDLGKPQRYLLSCAPRAGGVHKKGSTSGQTVHLQRWDRRRRRGGRRRRRRRRSRRRCDRRGRGGGVGSTIAAVALTTVRGGRSCRRTDTRFRVAVQVLPRGAIHDNRGWRGQAVVLTLLAVGRRGSRIHRTCGARKRSLRVTTASTVRRNHVNDRGVRLALHRVNEKPDHITRSRVTRARRDDIAITIGGVAIPAGRHAELDRNPILWCQQLFFGSTTLIHESAERRVSLSGVGTELLNQGVGGRRRCSRERGRATLICFGLLPVDLASTNDEITLGESLSKHRVGGNLDLVATTWGYQDVNVWLRSRGVTVVTGQKPRESGEACDQRKHKKDGQDTLTLLALLLVRNHVRTRTIGHVCSPSPVGWGLWIQHSGRALAKFFPKG